MATMENQFITSLDNANQVIAENLGVLFYFNKGTCSVGEALAPKVMELIKIQYPKINVFLVDMNALPVVAATHSVFV